MTLGGFVDALKRQVGSFRADIRRAKTETSPWTPINNGGYGGLRSLNRIPTLSEQSDPYPWLLRDDANNPYFQHRLPMGTDGEGDFIFTDERRNLLMLGPPRSDKTAGVLIPLILSALAPEPSYALRKSARHQS